MNENIISSKWDLQLCSLAMIGYVGLFILKPDGLFLFLFMDCIFSKEFMNASHFYSKKKEAKNAAADENIIV